MRAEATWRRLWHGLHRLHLRLRLHLLHLCLLHLLHLHLHLLHLHLLHLHLLQSGQTDALCLLQSGQTATRLDVYPW